MGLFVFFFLAVGFFDSLLIPLREGLHPVSLPFLSEIMRAVAELERVAERSGTGPQLMSGIEGF